MRMGLRRAPKEDSHAADVNALCFHAGRLYSGADDGKIKIWSEDFGLLKTIDAHPVNVYCLAVVPATATLYSSSNDGTIRAWCATSGDFKTELINYENEVECMYVRGDTLYAGDDKGSVGVFVDNKLKLIYNLVEEIKDLIVKDNLMYTVRDLDMTVTEFLSEENTRYMTRQTIEGKSPMCLAGDKLCFASRCGKNVLCHLNSKAENFKFLDKVEAHSMIINTMCSKLNPDDSVVLCTGSWDKTVKIWAIDPSGKISLTKSIDFETCVNKVCFGNGDQIFVAGSDGLICKIDL